MEANELLRLAATALPFTTAKYQEMAGLSAIKQLEFKVSRVLERQNEDVKWMARESAACAVMADKRFEHARDLLFNSVRLASIVGVPEEKLQRELDDWLILSNEPVKMGDQSLQAELGAIAIAVQRALLLMEEVSKGGRIPFGDLHEHVSRMLRASKQVLRMFCISREDFESWLLEKAKQTT
jgi:hypothetical protein